MAHFKILKNIKIRPFQISWFLKSNFVQFKINRKLMPFQNNFSNGVIYSENRFKIKFLAKRSFKVNLELGKMISQKVWNINWNGIGSNKLWLRSFEVIRHEKNIQEFPFRILNIESQYNFRSSDHVLSITFYWLKNYDSCKNCWQINQGDFDDKKFLMTTGISTIHNLLWFIFLIYINLTKFLTMFNSG